MTPSGSRRIRFLFRTEAVHRQFCWVEQRGDDLYWGPSRGAIIEGVVAEVHEQSTTLTVPDEIERAEDETVKASFHASGRFHLKQAGEMSGDAQRWLRKEEIEAPYRIFALLTKHPRLYEPYPSGRSLTRGRTGAQVIKVDRGQEATRHYLEFFVSPEGRFALPPPGLALKPGAYTEPKPMLFSLSERLILAARHLVVAPSAPISAWHPELEMWFFGDDRSNADLGNPRGPEPSLPSPPAGPQGGPRA